MLEVTGILRKSGTLGLNFAHIEEESIALALRAAQGDAQALGALYERYVDAIYRFMLYRVGDVPTAEDLTADVFANVITAIRRYEARGVPFEAWLFRIARARLVDHYRRAGRRPEHISLDELELNAEEEPDELPDLALRQALMSLSAKERDVVLLHFGSGLGHVEIAALLHSNPNAIKVRLHRALRKLQAILERRAQTEIKYGEAWHENRR